MIKVLDSCWYQRTVVWKPYDSWDTVLVSKLKLGYVVKMFFIFILSHSRFLTSFLFFSRGISIYVTLVSGIYRTHFYASKNKLCFSFFSKIVKMAQSDDLDSISAY